MAVLALRGKKLPSGELARQARWPGTGQLETAEPGLGSDQRASARSAVGDLPPGHGGLCARRANRRFSQGRHGHQIAIQPQPWARSAVQFIQNWRRRKTPGKWNWGADHPTEIEAKRSSVQATGCRSADWLYYARRVTSGSNDH